MTGVFDPVGDDGLRGVCNDRLPLIRIYVFTVLTLREEFEKPGLGRLPMCVMRIRSAVSVIEYSSGVMNIRSDIIYSIYRKRS